MRELTPDERQREIRAIASLEECGYEHLYTYTPDGVRRRVFMDPSRIQVRFLTLEELESAAFQALTNQ
jgi:meiotically up-regulated gene 157 (Mug157) protein